MEARKKNPINALWDESRSLRNKLRNSTRSESEKKSVPVEAPRGDRISRSRAGDFFAPQKMPPVSLHGGGKGLAALDERRRPSRSRWFVPS